MKEIIEGLNLPKQLIDKADRFMTALFGPSVKEIGELFADKIRYRRLKNQINIFKKTIFLLEENNLEVHELELKTLVPLIEKSSLEEDELLQDKWANLIVNISTSPENSLEPKLIGTLSSLSSIEARILDFIYLKFNRKKENLFNDSLGSLFLEFQGWKSVDDIPYGYIKISLYSVKDEFDLTDDLSRIYIDNLVGLGLIRYSDPEIKIDSRSSDAQLVGSRQQNIELDLDIDASYISSDDFVITHYGIYFIRQCKLEKAISEDSSKP